MRNIFKKNSTVVILLLILIVIVIAGFWFKKPVLTNVTTGVKNEVKKVKPEAPKLSDNDKSKDKN